jgi:hypothetical protein
MAKDTNELNASKADLLWAHCGMKFSGENAAAKFLRHTRQQ